MYIDIGHGLVFTTKVDTERVVVISVPVSWRGGGGMSKFSQTRFYMKSIVFTNLRPTGMCTIIRHTYRRQYEDYNTPQGHHTDQSSQGRSQYKGQGVYCSLVTASEVLLIITTLFY